MNAPIARPLPAAEVAPAERVLRDHAWYKDAVIYQLHIKSFFDSNNDGVGDFAGLIARLDYIASLGVTAIWLLPFYPSPRRDDGYDISDFRGVHEDYGKLADVRRFIHAAHARGLRVITELVVNHTSDQHPWFRRARQCKPGSAHRSFYVWSETDQKYAGTRVIFLDAEKSNWTWDAEAEAYYWHRFYSHQPDLNYDNPRVLREILSVMSFWLDLGIDGLRLDAVPYLVEREGTNNENLPETHAVLRQIRAELDRDFPGRMLLAEANQWPEDVKEYFGNGDECHMAFHFPLMPRMYMAIAREDRFPITDILRQTPDVPDNCQWAIFLRNHDELTLEMVTNAERDYLWETYAADRRARLNLGIRRRLTPLLERDRRRVELMNYLLFSMPGTPVLYYGDEIGMGDNILLGDRDGVRTPMQWSPDRNGGFSRADPASLVLPPIMDPIYGFGSVNVEAQDRDPHSLLNWTRRVLGVRRQHQAFGRGTFRLLYPKNRKVLAYLREYDEETILCVANLAHTPQAVELEMQEFAGRTPVELNGGSVFPPIGQLHYLLTLPPYGFYWFLLAREAEWPSWHTPAPEPMPEYQTIVIRRTLIDALRAQLAVLERDVLPTYLAVRRWFAAKDQNITEARLMALTALPDTERELLLAEIETGEDDNLARWQLPLAVLWEDEANPSPLPTQLALARVRRASRVGLLTDDFALPDFVRTLMRGFTEGQRLPAEGGEIRFEATAPMREIDSTEDAEIKWLSAEQSNSSLIVGDVAVVKLFRRIIAGPHPEAEMSRYLTERGFAHTPALLGEMVRVDDDGTRHTLAVAQAFLRNQGDAWTWMLDWMMRMLSELTPTSEAETEEPQPDHMADGAALAGVIGERLGEMHAVLAQSTDNPDFAAERADKAVLDRWTAEIEAQVDAALRALGGDRVALEESAAEEAEALRGARGRLLAATRALAAGATGTLLTRIHGDLHLGQMLVSSGDVFIIDFEGEPARPLAQRRAKTSPMRDLAGVVRSFDYACAVVRRKSREAHPHLADERREAFLTAFQERAGAAFLEGYRSTAPSGEDIGLLRLFLIEKAAYEIAYEAANRPSWIDVPLHGLARVADVALGTERKAAE